MKAVTGPLLLHSLGGLSFVGWLILSVKSARGTNLLNVFGGVLAWEWLMFLAGLCVIRRFRPSRRLGSIAAWAIAFRLCGLLAAPVLEDDHYRFLWDGRQFALTGNPYATAPAAHFEDSNLPERFEEILDHVNYPDVPTIYGPVCQWAFGASYLIAPGQLWPWKLWVIAADLCALAILAALAGRLPCVRGDLTAELRARATAAYVFGWCPLVVFETSFNAHPDILGVSLITAALLSRVCQHTAAVAVFCALGAGAKIFALILVPFIIGRSLKGWIIFGAVLMAVYLPFWMQRSLADLAGLAAFAREWEFNSSIYGLLRPSMGPDAAKLFCTAGFGLIWLLLLKRQRNARISSVAETILPPGAALFGAFFLLSPTVNPWYLLWLAPFAALRPGPVEFSALALVSLGYITGVNLREPSLDNFAHPDWVRPVEYGGVAASAALLYLWRRFRRMNRSRLSDQSKGM